MIFLLPDLIKRLLLFWQAGFSEQDKAQMLEDLLKCRKELLDCGLFNRPLLENQNIVQSALEKQV
ncbi:hypothetical protein Ciccas_004536 [Cichlidogyrus casuarinus]|uniref:Uncharacterized protein n=1 Tax=Cichlidogyrus casuarinus TaxID=1844966 RepID=A0ABD2QC61_9PLAT